MGAVWDEYTFNIDGNIESLSKTTKLILLD